MAEKDLLPSTKSALTSDWDDVTMKVPLIDDAGMNSVTDNKYLCDETDEDDEDDEDNWEPISEEDKANFEEETTCLFCPQKLQNIELAVNHVQTDHGVHFGQLKHKFQMNQYDFIQLINCIRQHSLTPEKVLMANKPFWKKKDYFSPKYYEPWFCYDYEFLEVEADTKQVGFVEMYESNDCMDQSSAPNVTTNELMEKIDNMTNDMSIMRSTYKRLLESMPQNNPLPKPVPLEDNYYFENYAHYQIHHEMLSDSVRTICYRDAFLKNSDFIRNKDVLDVGCGTGILSIFAQRAGARRIVAIDNSNIINTARANRINNIELVKGCVEKTDLPNKHFDIIVSEWMGYFLLFEGMLNSVIYARHHFLKPGGLLMPNRCSLHLAGLGSIKLYNQYISFWDDVYGVDMSVMKYAVLRESQLEEIDPDDIITEPDCVAHFDLMTIDMNYGQFVHKMQLKCLRDGVLNGFVGYFNVYFDMPQHAVQLSTSPLNKPTHWKQSLFFLEETYKIKAGQILEGTFACLCSAQNPRNLEVTIEIFGKKQTYFLD